MPPMKQPEKVTLKAHYTDGTTEKYDIDTRGDGVRHSIDVVPSTVDYGQAEEIRTTHEMRWTTVEYRPVHRRIHRRIRTQRWEYR